MFIIFLSISLTILSVSDLVTLQSIADTLITSFQIGYTVQ